MRNDGADWFVADTQELLPDFDDFDEDILQDEAVEEYGLTDESGEEVAAGAEDAVAVKRQTEEETDSEEMLDEYEVDAEEVSEDDEYEDQEYEDDDEEEEYEED